MANPSGGVTQASLTATVCMASSGLSPSTATRSVVPHGGYSDCSEASSAAASTFVVLGGAVPSRAFNRLPCTGPPPRLMPDADGQGGPPCVRRLTWNFARSPPLVPKAPTRVIRPIAGSTHASSGRPGRIKTGAIVTPVMGTTGCLLRNREEVAPRAVLPAAAGGRGGPHSEPLQHGPRQENNAAAITQLNPEASHRGMPHPPHPPAESGNRRQRQPAGARLVPTARAAPTCNATPLEPTPVPRC